MDENNNRIADQETIGKANRYFFGKVAVNLFLIILGAVFIAVFLRQMQSQATLAKQRENSETALSEAVRMLDENSEDAETLEKVFHDGNQDVLDDMDQLFSSGLFDSIDESTNKERSEVFADMVRRSGVEYLFIMSMDGKIVLSQEPTMYRVNPATRGFVTQENVNAILKGTVDKEGRVTPVKVRSQYGTYYFYSQPYKYKGTKYMLVLGSEASALEEKVNSLKEPSVVLSRSSVANKGFLFAVNKTDLTFNYYNNHGEVLTGRSALSQGLSLDALSDGYSGTETINGVEYFCMSKSCGSKMTVCAVTPVHEMYNNDRYVLFWMILGFVIVMIISLVYAVMVRNDFVRRSVVTDRKTLNPKSNNPVYFDKSIFHKLLPLLLAGVIILFGISFYTQTLLEITQGIEESEIALGDAAGRYEESIESRDIIQNYYHNRFLAKARLISFLIEEDPSVLNDDSDLFYSYYEDDGRRVYMKDDEGNRLKSVASSERLQELCDANDIKSVYIFDEAGRTIGTNTDKWYFTVSHNEEDQSYPFLQVLDGRVEHYMQGPEDSDFGDTTQFIGVSFNYYTRKDADGNTEYVSSFEYQTAQEDEAAVNGTSGDITEHHSMVQIELDAEMTEKLLESTDIANVLSTRMLRNGFILMFDGTDEHKCMYSPNEASIGKTAEELGVSDKAFSGEDYYGFSNINGTDYFMCYRYAEGNYAATALLRADMYQARWLISLITAFVSLILILVLSGTVTLTNNEEERLYEAVSLEEAARGRNRSIINMILPSGRTTTTVKAAARWDNTKISFSEKSPEQKLMVIVGGVIACVMLYIVAIYLGADQFFNEGSIIHYIQSGNWDKGLNIFALTACTLLVIVLYFSVMLLRIPVRIFSSLMGARGETIGHLLLSVAKYGSALFAVFYCLYLIGIDSSRLIASAGILSLIIGLGAQSLIKDIIAGIFIVFEGEFRVGDIVTIGGYRGSVLDIGLRTTKIMGEDGNIKIYNNSEISGVLNMTQESSIAITRISIEYGQDIEYVEAVLERELPKVAKANKLILDGPLYKGISSLGDSGVEIVVICYCNETDIIPVTRYLNRSVLKIFYDNNINVPFPNVTFSALDTQGRKTLLDLIEKRDAADSDEADTEDAGSDAADSKDKKDKKDKKKREEGQEA